jgi:hypothetical protein
MASAKDVSHLLYYVFYKVIIPKKTNLASTILEFNHRVIPNP